MHLLCPRRLVALNIICNSIDCVAWQRATLDNLLSYTDVQPLYGKGPVYCGIARSVLNVLLNSLFSVTTRQIGIKMYKFYHTPISPVMICRFFLFIRKQHCYIILL